MIVHPDFLDHWKTKRLIELTGDPTAPQMIIRLWGYCQVRRKSAFENLSGKVLASVCQSKVPGDKLLSFFIECGFIEQRENALIVHDWEQVNRMLVSAWTNGQKGGRPAPTGQNRQVSGRQPTDNRSTRAGVREEDKIRAGYRPVIAKDAGDQPAGSLASPERREESTLYEIEQGEKSDPANVKKFGTLLRGLSEQLKAGGDQP